jgi:glycosyltransferase involved in cell wall biosynthesis
VITRRGLAVRPGVGGVRSGTVTRPSPSAVLLVRNGVTHDARVQRAAGVLESLGHAVTIVGSITGTDPLRQERIGSADVLRLRARSPVGALRRLLGGRLAAPLAALHRILTTLDWNRRAVVAMRPLQPALIHANDYNTMWPALIARRLWGARVVYDSHELWADRNGRPEWRAWLVWTERRFVHRADIVITASPGYAAEIATRYDVPVPIVIRNIPDVPPPRSADPRDEAVYVGGLMPGRGLELTIAALADVPGLRLRLVGRGSDAYIARLRAYAAAAGVSDRVDFVGPVPADEVVVAAAGAAFGICLIEPICRSYELTLPNKLFEYAMAGVPILASDLPVIAQTVGDAGIGEVADPRSPQAIVDAITRLRAPERNAAARDAVQRFALSNTWQAERDRLDDVYRCR